MTNQSNIASPLPQSVQKVSTSLVRAGRVGFWVQTVLGIISALVLGGAAVSNNIGATQEGGQGVGFGIFLAICGLISLGVAVYFCFRYIGIASRLRTSDPSQRPSKADTIREVRLGLMVNLIGMFLTILGALATIGVILAKSLAQPQGLTTYDPNRFVRALDIFVVQANANTIAAHFAGILVSLWLLNRLTR